MIIAGDRVRVALRHTLGRPYTIEATFVGPVDDGALQVRVRLETDTRLPGRLKKTPAGEIVTVDRRSMTKG